MLRLSQRQLSALRQVAVNDFHIRMVQHLRSAFRHVLGDLSEQEMTRMVVHETNSALNFGIDMEDDIRRYLEYFVQCKHQHYPATDWSALVLSNPAIDGPTKMDLIEQVGIGQPRADLARWHADG